MAECTFDGCDKRQISKGLCNGHYNQQRNGKDLTPLRYRPTLPVERFWELVDKREDGCWIWMGLKTEKGYGRFAGRYRAHRFAWELLRGPIPDGYAIDHDNPEFGCHTPACVNPDHLEAVPNRFNIQRRRGAQVDSQTGERGVYLPDRKGLWRGEVKYTDEHGVQRSISKKSKDRAVVSAWVVEMRQKYHN